MGKVVDFTKTVSELVSENPEIKEVLAEAGFKEIIKPMSLAVMGKVMTIPNGAAIKNKFKDRDISFETLEKAVNGDYFAMQEVIRLFKPYMARLSIEEGRFNRELYERLVRKVMLITVRFKTDYDEK